MAGKNGTSSVSGRMVWPLSGYGALMFWLGDASM
jgi:hypothetical protein